MDNAVQELLEHPELIRRIKFVDDEFNPTMWFYVIRHEGWNAPMTFSYLGCRDKYDVNKAMLIDRFPEKVI